MGALDKTDPWAFGVPGRDAVRTTLKFLLRPLQGIYDDGDGHNNVCDFEFLSPAYMSCPHDIYYYGVVYRKIANANLLLVGIIYL